MSDSPDPSCALPEADEAQLEQDKLIFGTAYKYKCQCGRWHRLAPESVVVEYRRRNGEMLSLQSKPRATRPLPGVRVVYIDEPGVDKSTAEALAKKEDSGSEDTPSRRHLLGVDWASGPDKLVLSHVQVTPPRKAFCKQCQRESLFFQGHSPGTLMCHGCFGEPT